MTSSGSVLSLCSEHSVLSIGSKGSVLSVGSVGSVLSVGSIGSAGSVLSIGSFLAAGGVLSALSVLSILSRRSVRGVLAGGMTIATRFLGVDLAWGQRHRSGVAELAADGALLSFGDVTTDDELLDWLGQRCAGPVVVAFDAPLIVTNPTGSRPAEQTVGHLFGRQRAGCHPTNLGRPGFADGGRAARLAGRLGLDTDPRGGSTRLALEVYPHAALVAVLELDLILRYKDKPGRDLEFRRGEMLRLMDGLAALTTAPVPLHVRAALRWTDVRALVVGARTKAALSRVEDSLDAVVCAYVGLHAWRCPERTALLGSRAEGYIVTPVTAAMAGRLPAVRAAGRPASLWSEGGD